MNVLILDRSLGNAYAFGLAGGLRELGVDVDVAGPANWPSAEVLRFYRRNTPNGEERAAKLAESVLGVWRAALYGHAARPDVLHLQWTTANDIALALSVTAACRAHVVLTLHNPVSRHSSERNRFQEAALRMTRAIIVHGPTMRAQLLERHPELEPQVHCVEVGNYDHVIARFSIDEARVLLGLPHDQPVYSFLGNVRRRKGVEVFIRALAICRDDGVDPLGVIAGGVDDLQYLAELHALADALGVASSIRWKVALSPLPQRELDLVASASDQIVLPSLGASQSASVIFSMTHERCVVTSAIGELSRTVHERGLLVPPGSAEAVAEAMRLAVDDPACCRRLATRARAYAIHDLSWTRAAAQTQKIYELALQPA
jgi:glycosyltransferase involved in cell wall biosynthesis